jgi:hypothetical protein
MSKFKLIFGATIITTLVIAFACQKETSPQAKSSNFNPTVAKEWYYAEFKKSAEWHSSNLKGKKLPDWENGVVSKIGDNDIVEFPLVKKTKSFPLSAVAEGRTLSQAELSRLSNGSLSRIIFIRDKSGKTVVREMDYIPEWNYLVNHGFDISKASILNFKENFSGTVLVKTWSGATISSLAYKDGKMVASGKKVASTANANRTVDGGDCYTIEYCVWQQDCTLTFYSDGLVTDDCGEWYNTGDCWLEEYCPGELDPCLAFGYNCNHDDNPPCSMTGEEAESALNSIGTTIESNGASTVGAQTGPDANGIIKEPITIARHSITYNWFYGYTSKWTLLFPAVRYKQTNDTEWKWETLTFDKISRTAGGPPPCCSEDVSATAAVAMSGDKKTASFSATVTGQAQITCLFGFRSKLMIDHINDTYGANENYQ